jgi:hypothetical protein
MWRVDSKVRAPTYAIALLPFTLVVLWALVALWVEAREGGWRPEVEPAPPCGCEARDGGAG